LNMFMEPLIDELQDLWNGVRTYDSSRKEYFNMGKGKKDVSSSSRGQGKKNDGSASSDRPCLFRGSSSHLSRRSALQRCLGEAMQVSHM
jgi:hypothetical protein